MFKDLGSKSLSYILANHIHQLTGHCRQAGETSHNWPKVIQMSRVWNNHLKDLALFHFVSIIQIVDLSITLGPLYQLMTSLSQLSAMASTQPASKKASLSASQKGGSFQCETVFFSLFSWFSGTFLLDFHSGLIYSNILSRTGRSPVMSCHVTRQIYLHSTGR